MLYSLQSSFHSISVHSLSSTVLTPTTILLPLHIAAIHGISQEKPAAKGLVDSREQRTSAEFEGDGDILEDTAVGRKKIVLEQQLNAATLSMSLTKWNELLEIRKQNWGKEGVVGAAEEVIGGAEGV